jgi:uncharacterized membrane protein
MEWLGLALFVAGLLFVAPLLAVVALVRAARLQRELADLRAAIERLERGRDVAATARAAEPSASRTAPPTASPVTLPTVAAAATPAASITPAPTPPPAAPASPSTPPPRPPTPASTRPPETSSPGGPRQAPVEEPPRPAPPRAPARPPASPPPDFATSLGPKILVATGALAFVAFLGLFVKYAWESNWVGPTGRVLLGAATGVALLAVGLRLLGRRYRPLGQGLAGAGLAGLYVSAFAAHGFYGLVSREAAGVLMAAVTVNAVLLAARLDARLLGGLAWVGGYLTPFLLSTGEDKALALFLYLFLLDLGALVLDHRKPWPETVPLAMAGTLILYGGWYDRFFRPERFGVAAFGIVLFTALFALGAARKQRASGLGVSLLAGVFGLTVLAASVDRPEWLMVLSLVLATGALRSARAFGPLLAGVAALGAGLPFVAWSISHYRPASFDLAAVWIVAGALMFALPDTLGTAAEAPGVALPALPLIAAGIASVVLAGQTDRPPELLLFLLAQAGVAILARRRWSWAEVTALGASALAVLAWMDAYFKAERRADVLLIALPVAAAYLIALVVRGLVGRTALAREDAAAHLVNAAFVWTVLHRALYASHPHALGLAAVGLAALYLVLGLGTLRIRRADALQVRVELGLAAVFVTLAIPVQLGAHGITLAWSLEGVLLLALGLRFRSKLARAGGYFVLALSVLRLLIRHLPARTVAFTPVLNAEFGTWLCVIGTLGIAVMLLRRQGTAGPAEARLAAGVLSTSALVLLFAVLTWETTDVFDVRARLARLSGDVAAAEQAALAGRFALSVLWTVFATALLGAGLGARSRPLFYAAYGLFALTAFKVVLIDLATLQALYRMLSFLALALLLLAGAYLNLRFRERLLPREAAP